MKQRCFVGFFGITRGLNWTIDSIEQNVYAPLERAGLELFRAAHFNSPQVLHSPHSSEVGVPFSVGDLTRLKLDTQHIEPQSNDNLTPYLEAASVLANNREPDPDGSIRRNSMHQLYSLKGLGRLFEQSDPASYCAVILLRPDLRYIDPFPVTRFLAQLHRASPWRRDLIGENARLLRRLGRPEADIIVPHWQGWGGTNDRFAIATKEAARVYMNRLDYLPNYCSSHSFYHPESLLKFSLARAGMRVAGTMTLAMRTRSNGTPDAQDVEEKKKRESGPWKDRLLQKILS
jgi:hypothetical protein